MYRTLLMVSVMLVALLVFAGCGSKEEPPVVTDTTPVVTEPIVAEPVVEEPTDKVPPAPAPIDYASMTPQEYGIEDVFFAFDEYSLTDEAMRTLNAASRIMREHSDLVYMIEGHCDERGTVEYNLALGERRAVAVRDYLVSLGMPARQLRITSYGEERPFAFGSNESAWALNRRGHFSRP
ncbi:OmpA family protein [bacterium]|nr:OmpA family protein [bacterium]MBU1073972.1 OmpA family protein [bacterium]MBU1675737.1 OmpA family protein [bacterium]